MATEQENSVITEESTFDSFTNVIQSWDELELEPKILRGIFAYGFEKPSPIQQRAIKPVMEGRDIIAQAQSGTGKTATFTIGALHRVNLAEHTTQVLILSPTRELSTQTAKVVSSIGSFMDGLKIQTAIGGSALEDGSVGFTNKNAPHIVCGCPGRVYDMMRRDRIHSKTIKLLILDEADEMLSDGFKEQVYNIFQHLHPDVQVGLFSATLPVTMNGIVDKIMRNPVRVCVKREQLTLEGIRQFYIAVEDDRQKYLTLKNIFSNITLSHTIIYCNSIKRVQDLYEAMCEDGFPVCCIHSNMDKSARDKAFNDFRNGTSRVLISSNVTARGIDIQQVSVVVNFDLPKCVDTYLHRIGRSGRWGRKGVGINFITRRDVGQMKRIEEHYSTQINEMPADLGFLTHM
ncbi:MAG: DEAD/DEAH box helicase [Flavobacterium sp.]